MAGYTRQYRENRLRLLASNPTCHYCGIKKADTVDHVLELDRGGDDSLENLVPACKSCNSRKGQRYVTQKKALQTRTIEARRKAVGASEAERNAETAGVFCDLPITPSCITPSISKKAPKPARTAQDATESLPFELGRPRLVTPLLGGRTLGGDVARFAKAVLGLDLMPWQIEVLSGQLETDDAGELVRRYSLVSCARQNGKSTALKALVAYWLAVMPAKRGGPQTVITTAHALDLATALFQDLAPVLETSLGAKAKWSYGRNELVLPDGSTWLVRAATPSSGHGRSADLVIADEVWNISEEVLDQGLIPSQRARRRPLFSAWSTAGTDASAWFARFREQGLRAIDEGGAGPLYFAEYSVDPSWDVTRPELWAAANPAIGHLIDLQTLIDESKSPNRSAFLRASLNMWVSSDQGWLEPGIWDACTTDEQPPPATVMAIECSTDLQRWSGITATLLDDGRCYVAVAFQANSETELWQHVKEQLPPNAMLAYTPSLEVHLPMEYRRRSTKVGYGELVKWTALVRGMVQEGRLCHGGERSLADHMARAVAAKTKDGLALSSQRSPGPIELARLTVWAAALATRAKWAGKPTLATSRRP